MPFKDMEEYLSYRVEKSGHSWTKLKQEGVILAEHKPITVEEGLELKFDTPSGKVEFWSDQLAAKGFDPVPKYTKHPEAPPDHFRLITGRAPGHTFSRTQTNPFLHDLMPENEVWVNTATAARLGIKNRQYVQLKNQDGVQQPHPRQGHAAHPRGHRLHGLRLRPPQQDAQDGLPQRGQRGRPEHALRHRPDHGCHEHPWQLRLNREGGMRWPALEWSLTPANASGAKTAWSPARPRMTCRTATAATGSPPKCAGPSRS
jgi:hypothetical protein